VVDQSNQSGEFWLTGVETIRAINLARASSSIDKIELYASFIGD